MKKRRYGNRHGGYDMRDERRRNRRSRRRRARLARIVCVAALALAAACAVTLVVLGVRRLGLLPAGGLSEAETEEEKLPQTPEETLAYYVDCIAQGQYETLYGMLAPQSRAQIGEETFVGRNRNIYEGIEADNLVLQVDGTEENENGAQLVSYRLTMDTAAGEISFSHQAAFLSREAARESEEAQAGDGGQRDGASEPAGGGQGDGTSAPAPDYPYLLLWDDSMIFPNLHSSDKVQVRREAAQRGEILDRNGELLAGKGVASSVGLVPGKMVTEETLAASAAMSGALVYQDTEGGAENTTSVAQLAAALDISEESIERKLAAAWVKDDSFVPVKTIAKPDERELLQPKPDGEQSEGARLQERLLSIPGVMITDTEIRDYPLGSAAAHLTGYVQPVTAEDLEKHPGEGYRADSVIGRSGMETLYEKELKGQDGVTIAIVAEDGTEREILAQRVKRDGETIRLTIAAALQTALYSVYSNDASCSVAMNPYTGEVLALVSTPSFDSRNFVYGMSDAQWQSLNEDAKKPLYNRFRQTFCPGSSFKPIVAAIGIDNGTLLPDEDYGPAALRWQADESWGGYYVTTLHTYEPVTLTNALAYSDNIYFAKAALRMGGQTFAEDMERLGFGGAAPFEIALTPSQYSSDGSPMTQIQLADSGYGQGQMLVNPVHLTALYSGFANGGSVIRPYLRYRENAVGEVWLPQAYSEEAVRRVREGMAQVIADPHATGYAAHRDRQRLIGKTGTAEIKATVDDTTGTELGWFCVLADGEGASSPLLLVTMVEDVKERGGSGYVVERTNRVLDWYWG